jgi:hypothetical protein
MDSGIDPISFKEKFKTGLECWKQLLYIESSSEGE